MRNDDIPKEEIEKRAFEIYLMRGAEDGHAIEDWLAAEQQLRQGRAKKPQVPRSTGVAAGPRGRSRSSKGPKWDN